MVRVARWFDAWLAARWWGCTVARVDVLSNHAPLDAAAMTELEVIPLELATFRFPDPELAGRQGVVMGYAVRHPGGVFLFDTGFGFGNAELDEIYAPVPRPIREVLYDAGIDPRDVTAVANCHLHADHAGQNGAMAGIPIHVQSAEWEVAHTTDHTILDWIDAPGEGGYLLIDGDHDITPSIRLVATPGHTRGHQSVVIGWDREIVIVLAGQACYTAGEWDGDPDALEGRSGAPDVGAYDESLDRLKGLTPRAVYFAHDRSIWTP
jgi:glyoxylase-like metal-dependent hydrolase (beta-lactamase superfamily II)